jgi:hypothetical protein
VQLIERCKRQGKITPWFPEECVTVRKDPNDMASIVALLAEKADENMPDWLLFVPAHNPDTRVLGDHVQRPIEDMEKIRDVVTSMVERSLRVDAGARAAAGFVPLGMNYLSSRQATKAHFPGGCWEMLGALCAKFAPDGLDCDGHLASYAGYASAVHKSRVLKHPRATWSYLHGLLLQPDCRDADADAARGATEGARAQSARVLERAWHVVLGATPRLPRRTQRKELPKKLRWVDVENRQNPEGPEPNRGREEL